MCMLQPGVCSLRQELYSSEPVSLCLSQSGKYCYDYTIAQEGKPEKRLRSIWSMVPSQALVTLTVQCDAQDYSKYAGEFDSIVNSFKYN